MTTDADQPSCCAPARTAGGAGVRAAPAAVRPPTSGRVTTRERVELAGGSFAMGTDDREGFADDGEGPVREVVLSPFAIDTTAVTNAEFAAFVTDTGYETEAVGWGWSYVFAGFLPAGIRKVSPRPPATPWWCAVRGADWRHPEGPGSDVEERLDHPVVHVSWADAAAYAAWAGGRLPTEAEWEYAARGGLASARYPWGDELTPGGRHLCNIWQGSFPVRNTAADGHRGTAPVRSFPANGYGLHEVSGNVWEWTADWWRTDHGGTGSADPVGPDGGTAKVMRGGSYLCHASYCNRYRVAARSRNDPDSSSGNQGFRCVYGAADPGPAHRAEAAPR